MLEVPIRQGSDSFQSKEESGPQNPYFFFHRLQEHAQIDSDLQLCSSTKTHSLGIDYLSFSFFLEQLYNRGSVWPTEINCD